MDKLWASTRDTKEAAALATLGIPIRLERMVDQKTGQEFCTFQLASTSEDGKLVTGSLRRLYKKQAFEKESPAHPMLWCLVALRNRERILDLANRGQFMRPVRLPGGQCLLQASSQGLPGFSGQKAAVKVTELEMAASLITLGVDLLAIQGERGSFCFYFANQSSPLSEGRGCLLPNVSWLLHDYRRGLLAGSDPEHPLLYAMMCLYNRSALIRAMRAQVQMVILKKPNSPKSALVRADASDKAWDKAQKHFGM